MAICEIYRLSQRVYKVVTNYMDCQKEMDALPIQLRIILPKSFLLYMQREQHIYFISGQFVLIMSCTHTISLLLDVMKIVAAINTKCFRGTVLKAEWVHSSVAPSKTPVELPMTKQVAKITEEKSHLLITIPDSSVEIKTLENILEAATSMERKKDFILDKLSDSVMTVNFQNHMTKDGKHIMHTSIAVPYVIVLTRCMTGPRTLMNVLKLLVYIFSVQ